MQLGLERRVVLITGGNSGIGLGMAQACAEAGADVAIWGTNPAKNEAAEARLRATGRQVVALRCDVAEEDEVVAAFAETVERLGKVDAFFANAGVGGWGASFTEMTLEEWRRVLRVNLDGTFLCLREAARHMVKRGEGGALVATSSLSAIHGAPGAEQYAASKAALPAVMRSLAVELARHNVRCNSMLIGWTETEMNEPVRSNEKFMANTTYRTPIRRWGQPEDIGPVAVFLANPEWMFHTGDSIVVDGGYSVF